MTRFALLLLHLLTLGVLTHLALLAVLAAFFPFLHPGAFGHEGSRRVTSVDRALLIQKQQHRPPNLDREIPERTHIHDRPPLTCRTVRRQRPHRPATGPSRPRWRRRLAGRSHRTSASSSLPGRTTRRSRRRS